MLDLDPMVFEVLTPIFSSVAATDHDHSFDACMVNEFRTQKTGFTRYQEPGATSRNAIGCGITDDIHLSMMAANLHSGTRLYFFGVTQTHIAAAQMTASSWSPVIAIHQNDIAMRIKE